MIVKGLKSIMTQTGVHGCDWKGAGGFHPISCVWTGCKMRRTPFYTVELVCVITAESSRESAESNAHFAGFGYMHGQP